MRRGEKNRRILGLSKRNEDVVKTCKALNEKGAKYVVVGAIACNLHGLIRATKDLDLLIPRDVLNTGKVLEALGDSLVFGIARELDAEEVSKKPFTIIGDTPRVDLLTVANRVKYEEAKEKSLVTRIDGVVIPYVDFQTLVKTKTTGRTQDKADIERLTQILGKGR